MVKDVGDNPSDEKVREYVWNTLEGGVSICILGKKNRNNVHVKYQMNDLRLMSCYNIILGLHQLS